MTALIKPIFLLALRILPAARRVRGSMLAIRVTSLTLDCVFLNRGDGTLGRSRVYAVLPEYESSTPDPQSIAIADLNGDRRPDLVTATSRGTSRCF